MVTDYNKNHSDVIVGLSKDTKPVDDEKHDIPNGAFYYVIDWVSASDDPIYMFDKQNQTWHSQGGGA